MAELPEVGKTYEHEDLGYATVTEVRKRGRGYYVVYECDGHDNAECEGNDLIIGRQRLKDWNKAIQ
jgi:hypothetical protein